MKTKKPNIWSIDGGYTNPIINVNDFGIPIHQDFGLTKRDFVMAQVVSALTKSTTRQFPNSFWEFIKSLLARMGLWRGIIKTRVYIDERKICALAGKIANEFLIERKLFYKFYRDNNGEQLNSDSDATEDAVATGNETVV